MPNYNYYQYNRTRMNLITPPTEEPVTVSEGKAYLGITDVDENCKIKNWIQSIRESIELYLGSSIMTQTWQLFFDIFPFSSRYIIASPLILEVPKAPLVSVTHIKHYDENDVATTIAASEYQVAVYSSTDPWNGRIAFKDSFAAPSITSLRNIDSTEIEFVAGYADTDDVPQLIKTAIMQELAFRNKIQTAGGIDAETINGVYSVKYGASNNEISTGISESTAKLLQPLKKIRL